MKSNYEPLGKHIRLVDYRNSEEVTSTVLGISIDKEFMPSVANVIGTDLSRYKLISKGLFACNPMHVGRDERLPIALYEKDNAAIVSPAYFMFEIIDRDVLNEEYLMMWFRRPEFDRECWFMTDGSVRGGITWDDLCRIKLPVPSYARQCEIVESYRAITNRIALKRAENDNLAQQAQLLFDFMFQDISGSKHIGDFIVPQRGTALLSKDAIPGDIPVVAGGLVPSTYHNAANTVAPVITISSSGANAGFVNLWGVPVWSSDSSFIDFKMTPYVYFWHALLKRHQNNIYKIQTGSAQPHIYPSHIASLPVCDLDFGKVADYTERVTPLFTLISKNYKESNQLRALRDWLLPMLMNGQATISD